MASDTSCSSSNPSEKEEQLSLSEEDSDVEAKIQGSKNKRPKKLPARYREGLQSEKDSLEIEMNDSK